MSYLPTPFFAYLRKYFLFFVIILAFLACAPEPEDPPSSTSKTITSFSFSVKGTTVPGIIDEKEKTISVTVPWETSISNLNPSIEHTGKSHEPKGAQNFASPVIYTIIAEDSTTQSYTVTVTVSAIDAKAITRFSLPTNPVAIGIIDEGAKTITITVPFGADITNLKPTIIHTGVDCDPNPNGSRNFTTPQTYTIKAGDNSTAIYTIYVNIAVVDAKAITGFSFITPAATGTIDEEAKTITVNFPFGTDVTSLTPVVVHTGKSYSPLGAQNFTIPRVYTITAADGSTQNYTVTVRVPAILSVSVSPSTVSTTAGTAINQQLTATVFAVYGALEAVTWSIYSEGTTGGGSVTVSPTGLLNVAASATEGTAIIRATSTLDPTKYGICTVTVNAVPPGIIWTARTAALQSMWVSVCYGNGLFVAVANNGAQQIMTSPDGINWTARTTPVLLLNSVYYGNGLFVATAQNLYTLNNIMTSPDGINWTARQATEQVYWFSACYGNGLFVAVSNGGTRVMTSPDGITWTARQAAAQNEWISVCYGNGLFVAIAGGGGANLVMTSPDGINWTARTPAEQNQWRSVCYGNGLFVAVANTGTNRIMTSPDGITWTARAAAAQNQWFSVCHGNGLFVATANDGTNRIMTSPDGINWTAHIAAEQNQWRSVCYGNGLFVAVANSGTNRVMTGEIK